jgi:hypothetical protein
MGSALLVQQAVGQVRASERGTVSQVVDGTEITIDYSRPVARGRSPLFGRVVRWGDTWTPGANWATTLELSHDVQVNGQLVAKGKYSMWVIPRENEDWTIFLSSNVRVFHTQKQKAAEAKASFTVKPKEVPHVEVLTWSFPEVSAGATTLQLQWGTTALPLQISTASGQSVAQPHVDVTPYLGAYRLKFEPEGGGQAFEMEMEMIESNGRLKGRFSQPPPNTDPEFDLVEAGQHSFKPVYYRGGKVFEQDEETDLVFQVVDGRATGFELRFQREVYGRGVRKE